MLEHYSLIAVVIAALISYFIGFIWYSPALFGKTWGEAFVAKEGITKEDMKPSPELFIGALVLAGIMAYGLALLMELGQVHTFGNAIWLSFVAWLALVATTHFSGVIWARKPLTMYFVDVSCVLAQIVLITLFLTWWG